MPGKLQQIIFLCGRRGFLRFCFNSYREFLLRKAHDNQNFHSSFKGVIFCIDGKVKHGGLADRFHGLLCTYALCKIHHLPFKINWTYPFNLSTFLQPNSYDWTIEVNELSYSKSEYIPKVELGNYDWYKNFKTLTKKRKQIHFYANVRVLKEINFYYQTHFSYQQLYDELFLPSVRLSEKLRHIKLSLPDKYISFCFRFRNCLGDFHEANSQPLSQTEQDELLRYALTQIEALKNTTGKEVVVTADSPTFLSKCQSQNGTYICLQNLTNGGVHMDYTDCNNDDVFEQSFIDYYALSRGEKIYVCTGKHMYISSFPLFAANITGKMLYHFPLSNKE